MSVSPRHHVVAARSGDVITLSVALIDGEGSEARITTAAIELTEQNARGLARTLNVVTLTPEERHDWVLYRGWRNRFCERGHVLCFGQPNCITPDEMVAEIAVRHSEDCPCWKHGVLRHVRRITTP